MFQRHLVTIIKISEDFSRSVQIYILLCQGVKKKCQEQCHWANLADTVLGIFLTPNT